MGPILLGSFAGALLVSFVACALALQVFPRFRSGEHKEGVYRPDQSAGSTYQVQSHARGLKRRIVRVSSSELPLVGGPAMVLAVAVTGVGVGLMLGLDDQQWNLLGILLIAMVGYAMVGFLDDFFKFWRGSGVSEWQKFAGVTLVSLAAGIALNRQIVGGAYSARLPYPPYRDIPWLGHILVDTHFAWIAFFLLMTVVVATSTSLATDFSDGMDGLCGGLLLSASLTFAVILINQHDDHLQPLIVASLAVAGASVGYLPFNWPSSWKARGLGRGRRRARLIMGDTGSLALGGILALIAVMSRLEPLLIIVGGVFVLEGASALISARILVKVFRRSLVLERFNSSRGFPHTEFPLPFLGTPMHHHYDLLGWDRQIIVYGAWLVSAVLGLLGVASVEAPFTWERYLARLVGLVVILSVWQMGPRTRNYFIGLTPVNAHAPGQVRYLTLNYGYPFRMFGLPLYGRIDSTSVVPGTLQGVGEELTLWQRLSVADARALLGYYCYRAGAYADALRIWDRIPQPNRDVRPGIGALLTELKVAQAVGESDGAGMPIEASTPETGAGGAGISSLGTHAAGDFGPAAQGDRELAAVHADGSGTFQASQSTSTDLTDLADLAEDPATSAWRLPVPSSTSSFAPPRLEPTPPLTPTNPLAPGAHNAGSMPSVPAPGSSSDGTPLWSAKTWANRAGPSSESPLDRSGDTAPSLPAVRGPDAFTPGDIYGALGQPTASSDALPPSDLHDTPHAPRFDAGTSSAGDGSAF